VLIDTFIIENRRTKYRQRCGLRARRRAGVTLKVHGKFTRAPMWRHRLPCRRQLDRKRIGKIPILRTTHWNFSNLTDFRYPGMPAGTSPASVTILMNRDLTIETYTGQARDG
jgi:hypothetical protein